MAELHGNRKVFLGATRDDEPNEVRVDNPHDYKALLEYSLGKIFYPDQSRQEAEKILEHEFGHHVLGLGERGLEMKYGVSFVEDSQTEKICIAPYVNLIGTTRAGVVRSILNGPAEKSETDKIFLRKK